MQKYNQDKYIVYVSKLKYTKIIKKATEIKEKEISDKFDFWVDKAKEKFLRISPYDNNKKEEIPMCRENFFRIISTAISHKKNKNNPELLNKIHSHNKKKYTQTILKRLSHKN